MEHLIKNSPELLILLFIVITFLQSGIDKIVDWKGQTGWLKGHFEKTFMRSMVPLSLGIILIAEIVAGIFAIIGMYQLIAHNEFQMAFYAALLAAITLLFLLFGQRIAKDYVGASTIVIYFIVVVFGVWLLASRF